MDEKREASLRKFFFVSSAIFFVCYLLFMLLSILPLSFSMPTTAGFLFLAVFILMLNAAVREKAEDLGGIDGWSFLSLPFFTYLVVIVQAVMIYALKIKRQEDIIWAVMALYTSGAFDNSFRALRKLKRT